MAYDGDELREELERHRTKSVIPNRPNRRHPFSFSKRLYKLRWRIESAFNRLKDFRRIATRYDKLGRNYLHLSASPQPLYGGFNRVLNPSAVFGFEVPTRTRGYHDRNLKSTALRARPRLRILGQPVGKMNQATFCSCACDRVETRPRGDRGGRS